MIVYMERNCEFQPMDLFDAHFDFDSGVVRVRVTRDREEASRSLGLYFM